MVRDITLIAITTILSLLTALTAFAVRAETSSSAPDHASYQPEIVGITGEQLLPTVAVVSSDAAFGWLNYSSRAVAISFDEDVAAKMMCTSKTPFRVHDGELTAPKLAGGAFATLCALAPGEYDYRVELADSPKVLLGKIVSKAD